MLCIFYTFFNHLTGLLWIRHWQKHGMVTNAHEIMYKRNVMNTEAMTHYKKYFGHINCGNTTVLGPVHSGVHEKISGKKSVTRVIRLQNAQKCSDHCCNATTDYACNITVPVYVCGQPKYKYWTRINLRRPLATTIIPSGVTSNFGPPARKSFRAPSRLLSLPSCSLPSCPHLLSSSFFLSSFFSTLFFLSVQLGGLSGECCELPQRGPGHSPNRKHILEHFGASETASGDIKIRFLLCKKWTP